jgi:hypothetical protein
MFVHHPGAIGAAGGWSRVCYVIARSGRDEAIHSFLNGKMDCFAEPVIGRAIARPVGSQ